MKKELTKKINAETEKTVVELVKSGSKKIIHTVIKKYVDPQGRKASFSGKKLEDIVEELLISKNISAFTYKDWIETYKKQSEKQNINLKNNQNILLKRVPYTRFHGANGIGEFLLLRRNKESVRIECRGQYSQGSVDDKLAALWLDAQAFKERKVIIVIDGNGFKPKALKWFKDSCKSIKYKSIKVMSLDEFNSWVEYNI